MPLQNFTDGDTTNPVKAVWLNAVDTFYFTLFNAAVTAATARAAINASSLTANTFTGDQTLSGASALRGCYGSGAVTTNLAVGDQTLVVNTVGSQLTAVGYGALYSNSLGSGNSAFGMHALKANTGGNYNSAVGVEALLSNVNGIFNVAVGYQALTTVTSGSTNTSVGTQAGSSVTTGSNNVTIGTFAGTDAVRTVTSASDEIVMGNTGHVGAYIKIGWTTTSDARDKTQITPLEYGLAFVCALRPISYRFNTSRVDATPTGPLRYGFKAQDVMALEGTNPVIINADDPENLKYNDSYMTPVFAKAIQELKAALDAITADYQAYKVAHP